MESESVKQSARMKKSASFNFYISLAAFIASPSNAAMVLAKKAFIQALEAYGIRFRADQVDFLFLHFLGEVTFSTYTEDGALTHHVKPTSAIRKALLAMEGERLPATKKNAPNPTKQQTKPLPLNQLVESAYAACTLYMNADPNTRESEIVRVYHAVYPLFDHYDIPRNHANVLSLIFSRETADKASFKNMLRTMSTPPDFSACNWPGCDQPEYYDGMCKYHLEYERYESK